MGLKRLTTALLPALRLSCQCRTAKMLNCLTGTPSTLDTVRHVGKYQRAKLNDCGVRGSRAQDAFPMLKASRFDCFHLPGKLPTGQ